MKVFHNKPRVLIVENDEINAMVMEAYLKDKYEVDIARNSILAMKFADAHSYDLILMDINLGVGMNGIELLREMRKKEHLAFIPVIATTAYALDKDKEEFLENGFTHYLSKPFFKEELLALASEALYEV